MSLLNNEGQNLLKQLFMSSNPGVYCSWLTECSCSIQQLYYTLQQQEYEQNMTLQ